MAGQIAVSEPAAAPITAPVPDVEPDPLTTGELLVEEVSIDGLCGVY